MPERLANLGYMAVKKETTPGTIAGVPSLYIPLYDSSFLTDNNRVSIQPIVGQKFLRYSSVQGQRKHTGNVTTQGEPNTCAYLFDMLLTQGSPSGGDPYTHPFTLGTTVPNSYTVDQSYGQVVFRYLGVQADNISPDFSTNEMKLKTEMSGLKSFTVRELSGTPAGPSPWTISLKTDYDASPNTGLIAGDTIQLYKAADGTTLNLTVATVAANGTDITTTTADPTSFGVGDFLYIRPATPSYTLRDPFMWAKTQFCFGATASAALGATHTPLEQKSDWTVMHNFQKKEGEDRSGSFDPASLARTTGDVSFLARRFFDTLDEANRWASGPKRAVVIRHYSEGSTYELRLTINNFKWSDGGVPPMKAAEIVYHELKAMPQYDTSDSQAFDLKVINKLATV